MDKLVSQSIRNLRFPLCVAIVMVQPHRKSFRPVRLK